MKVFIISGLSGSGKTVGLHSLEDMDFYCIDNLPANMLPAVLDHCREQHLYQVAVSVDSRNISSLRQLPAQIELLKDKDIDVNIIFADADNDILIRRFKESRRKHPLSSKSTSLLEAINTERKLLQGLRESAHFVIDTSDKNTHQLRRQIRAYVLGARDNNLILLFESFGFKYGIPRDADYVFDVRCLPNPYWEQDIKHLSGLDQPVIEFFEKQELLTQMFDDISTFIDRWVPHFKEENRSNLTIAIGCTGGHHRSVYLSEKLSKHFADKYHAMTRHRDLTDTASH